MNKWKTAIREWLADRRAANETRDKLGKFGIDTRGVDDETVIDSMRSIDNFCRQWRTTPTQAHAYFLLLGLTPQKEGRHGGT